MMLRVETSDQQQKRVHAECAIFSKAEFTRLICLHHGDESGLYAANTGIEHTRKYSLCS